MGKPKVRWKDAVWRDTVDKFQLRNWKAAARKIECWRKVIGQARARKLETHHRMNYSDSLTV